MKCCGGGGGRKVGDGKGKVAGDSKVLEYVPGISKKYGVLPKMKRLQVW